MDFVASRDDSPGQEVTVVLLFTVSMLRDRRIVTASKFSTGDGRTAQVSTARVVRVVLY